MFSIRFLFFLAHKKFWLWRQLNNILYFRSSPDGFGGEAGDAFWRSKADNKNSSSSRRSSKMEVSEMNIITYTFLLRIIVAIFGSMGMAIIYGLKVAVL